MQYHICTGKSGEHITDIFMKGFPVDKGY
jgi:hypothetical protein